MRRATSAVTDFYDDLLKPFGVTVNQFSLLAALKRHEGSGTGELARHMCLEKSTLVRSLQPLVKAQLVEDVAPEGIRAHNWRLSVSGRSLVEQATPIWKEAQARVRTALSDNHRQLFDLLEGLGTLAHRTEDGAE